MSQNGSIEALHEEVLGAMHTVFRRAMQSRAADRQDWLTVFWLLVKLGVKAGLDLGLLAAMSEELPAPGGGGATSRGSGGGATSRGSGGANRGVLPTMLYVGE